MGVMDAFEREDRAQVKMTTLYKMMKESARSELVMNAVNCNVPHRYIREMATGEKEEAHEEEHLKIINRIKELQYAIAKTQTIVGKMVESAEAEDRHYIKIYADDEPSVKAEKLYQICGETQKREVTEWLKEYFPSAEPKTGKWIETGDDYAVCSECGGLSGTQFDGVEPIPLKTNFCPKCGARMLSEDGEA